jgi:hypothetical protein
MTSSSMRRTFRRSDYCRRWSCDVDELDCPGTQAFVLAQSGFRVTATAISEEARDRHPFRNRRRVVGPYRSTPLEIEATFQSRFKLL